MMHLSRKSLRSFLQFKRADPHVGIEAKNGCQNSRDMMV